MHSILSRFFAIYCIASFRRLVWVLCIMAGSNATAQVQLKFMKDTVIGASGGTCQALIRVINDTKEPFSFGIAPSVPEGCQIISKLKPKYEVIAKDTLMVPIKIFIGKNVAGNSIQLFSVGIRNNGVDIKKLDCYFS